MQGILKINGIAGQCFPFGHEGHLNTGTAFFPFRHAGLRMTKTVTMKHLLFTSVWTTTN
jgi:hypothetical protein